jgi:hypothetical protein
VTPCGDKIVVLLSPAFFNLAKVIRITDLARVRGWRTVSRSAGG